ADGCGAVAHVGRRSAYGRRRSGVGRGHQRRHVPRRPWRRRSRSERVHAEMRQERRSVRAGHRARRGNPGDQEPGFRHAVRKCWRYGESDRRTERRRSRHLEDRTITVTALANMRTTIIIGAMLFALTLAMAVPASAKDLWDRVEHHDANSNGVK